MVGLAWIILSLLCLTIVCVRERSFPLGVLAGLTAVLYGLRAFGIALGFDDPTPRNMFDPSDISPALDQFGFLLFVYIAVLLITYLLVGTLASVLSATLPLPRRRLDKGMVTLAMVVLAGIAFMVAGAQVVENGGVAAAISEAKSGRVSGEALLRIPATLALILSASELHKSARDLDVAPSRGRLRSLSAGVLVVAALSASVWGSRQFIVLAVGYVLAAPAITAFRNARRGWVLRVVLSLAVVIAIGFGLRLYRDDALGGETAVTSAEGEVFRQVSIAANGANLDSSLLAMRDFPATFAFRGGEDFRTGLWGALPAGFRPSTLEFDSFGANFHRLYEPGATSGWPVGSPVEWFVNLGWAGVVLGGMLSGLVYRAIAEGLSRSKMPELSTMVALVLTTVVVPLGVSSSSPNRFVIHAVPLLLLLGALDAAGRSAHPKAMNQFTDVITVRPLSSRPTP